MGLEDIIIDPPQNWKAKESNISVIGVGGGGCNAVNFMFRQNIQGCRFIVCNTDSQSLGLSPVPTRIQLGAGLGAGTDSTKGRNYALDSQEQIEQTLFGNNIPDMLFITAGMGGGTGTGAAPVIAKMSKERGILTVAVVTLPFENDGKETLGRAIDGINELKKNVDSLLLINNEKLYSQFGSMLIQEAYPKADEVLATAVRGIIEIIKKPGYVNVDFEDVKTVMKESGLALMGCGKGNGANRVDDAVNSAIHSPLLNDFVINTAQKVLLNITVANNKNGLDMAGLKELTDKIQAALGSITTFKKGIIWNEDPDADDTIAITVVATGFEYSKLNKITNVDLGNLIIIDNEFTYDRQKSMESSGGIRLPETPECQIQTIGFSGSRCQRTFFFTDDRKPALAVAEGQNVAELENIPAIRRTSRTEKKNQ